MFDSKEKKWEEKKKKKNPLIFASHQILVNKEHSQQITFLNENVAVIPTRE